MDELQLLDASCVVLCCRVKYCFVHYLRRFILCDVHQSGNQVKDDMGRAYSMHERDANCVRFILKSL